MNEARLVEDERGQTGRREGSAAVGGSEPDREHQERGRVVSANRHPDATAGSERGGHQLRRDDAHAEYVGDGSGRYSHASFFSGVGGMDLGLEAAGWRTVSFSEIDPYACAVLAHHWPTVPNLGSVTDVAEVPDATLWTGGFPCTDLSIAGKRAGLRNEDGTLTRSGLAYAFLDLVERHRPEVLLMENVYGLYSSNAGRDLGALIRQMDELGYVGAWRGLDAQWFGVPQRRKRVFILAFDAQRHPDPDGPGTVLAIGTVCPRDHKSERAAKSEVADRTGYGAQVAGALSVGGHVGIQPNGQDAWTNQRVVSAPADPGGMRASDGLAGWMDHRPLVATALDQGAGGVDDNNARGGRIVAGHFGIEDDPLLPRGLDSKRYEKVGNGVVAPVAYWIGLRLRRYLEHAASSRD